MNTREQSLNYEKKNCKFSKDRIKLSDIISYNIEYNMILYTISSGPSAEYILHIHLNKNEQYEILHFISQTVKAIRITFKYFVNNEKSF